MDTIKSKGLENKVDLIAYIPAHRRKEALRGYNQAELLASYIAEKLDKPLLKNNLVKLKWTEDQSHSNKAERVVNLKDSFHIKNPDEIRGKKILLIDDIITTGATMEESSRVLMNNGAKEVIGLALTSSKKF
ncbi:MAG: ComF family protein [Tissierellia bacterium]|nr:ComF family protein [Tissierellia bacterium]